MQSVLTDGKNIKISTHGPHERPAIFGAAASWVCPGADDGGKFAACHDDLAWLPGGLRHTSPELSPSRGCTTATSGDAGSIHRQAPREDFLGSREVLGAGLQYCNLRSRL